MTGTEALLARIVISPLSSWSGIRARSRRIPSKSDRTGSRKMLYSPTLQLWSWLKFPKQWKIYNSISELWSEIYRRYPWYRVWPFVISAISSCWDSHRNIIMFIIMKYDEKHQTFVWLYTKKTTPDELSFNSAMTCDDVSFWRPDRLILTEQKGWSCQICRRK